jgi:ABC-type transport system involved in multi-copper enzyme maturation permease subunit
MMDARTQASFRGLRTAPPPPAALSGGTGEARPWRPVAMIFRREVRRVTGDFRYPAIAVLLLAVMALAALSAGARYRGELFEQRAVEEGYARQLATLTVGQAADLLHPAVKPPWRLSLVADGGQTATPNVYAQALRALVPPEIRRVHGSNYRLPGHPPLDWTFALCVLLPLAAFLLGYDAVCGEREEGTLQLLLSYPVARWKVLAGKLLALWSCLAAPFLAGALLSLLLARTPSGIPLQGADLARAGLVALLGLWAIGLFVLVTLLVSTLSREASSSLSVLAWLWVLGVVVVPAVGGLLAHRLLPIPGEEETARRMAAIDRRIAREYAGREGHWRPPVWAAADGFAWERVSAEAENRRSAGREEVRRRVLQRKIDQARLVKALAWVSPASLAADLAERLAGSGPGRDESFIEQAWAFRSGLAERLRALDAGDPESPHILFFSGYVSERPLPPGAVARFAFREIPVREGLLDAIPLLTLFGAETLALAAASLFSFSRYEVSET